MPVVFPSARSHPLLVLDEPAAVVWCVQMNTIVFHPWPSRSGNTDNPDQLRIDLDPQPGTDFRDAVPAALEMRNVLREAGLESFIKTSGNRGIHLYAPIEPEWEFLDVRHAVIAAARELERRMPEKVTTSWWKEERGEKIFVDFNQANRDRTIAGAYSPRALPHAPVSTPITWDELPSVDPKQFTVLTVPERLATIGDPWADFHAAPGRIDTLLDVVAARPRRGARRAVIPAGLPEDAWRTAARAAEQEERRQLGCRRQPHRRGLRSAASGGRVSNPRFGLLQHVIQVISHRNVELVIGARPGFAVRAPPLELHGVPKPP